MLLTSAPLKEISKQLISGEMRLADYVKKVLARVEEINPFIEAVLPEINRKERLLAEAERLEKAYPDPLKRPPLYGALLGVKDIYHVEGFLTKGGSNLDPALLTGPEADSVTLLRQAGALVLGKTVTTEFAYFEPGPTRNPHNLEHTPGGSSSGSAAAVAAGITPLALGTQTIGSVNRPAAFCGVVGYKPSYGRIPTGGLLYFAPSLDHVGFFTQDVEGAELAAEILVKGFRKTEKLSKPVLAIPAGRYLEQAEEEALMSYWQQLDHLKAAGYELMVINSFADMEEIIFWNRKLAAGEMARVHQKFYENYSSLYRPRTAELIEEGQKVSDTELAEAKNRQLKLRKELELHLNEAGADLYITPSAPGPAPEGISATGNPAMNMPFTNAGLPTLTIPAGRSEKNGLPVALQLVAPYSSDEALFCHGKELAKLFEAYQAYNHTTL